MDLLKLAGISVQMQPTEEPSCGCSGPCGCGMSESDGAGFDEATTEPNPEEFPDGISTLGSVSDTSLRRYLKARGDHVTVDEEIYPDYTVEDVAESYKAFTEKAKNPYAIGMAQAMKSTGDEPPLKKSTITKAHDIAKAVTEAELSEVSTMTEVDPALQQLRKEVWNAIREIQTGAAAGKDMTDDILDELGDYYDDVQASGDPDLIKSYTEVRSDAPDQPPRVQAKIALLAMNAIFNAYKKDKAVKEADEDIKVGDTVKPTKGPHKGHPHEVIHDFGDGHYNVKPVGLRANQIRYGLGAAKAHKSDLVKEEITNEAAKPDYIDIDGDGDKKEPMKKAAKDKEETKANESLEYLKKLAGLE